MSFEYDDVAYSEESHSEDESTETLDYQDWSTIYSDELWEMWYQIHEYLDNRFPYNGDDMCKVEPDDFFYEFCFQYSQNFQRTSEFLDWQDKYMDEMKHIWRLIHPYRTIYGNKSFDDLCYLFHNAKKYKSNIYVAPRPNLEQGGYSSSSIPHPDTWFHPFY